MENTIRKIARAIQDHYVDKKKAKTVADSLVSFIGSPGWERYVNTNNLARLIWNLNCIITNTADDGHFYISSMNGGQSGPRGSGIERFTPHYIKIRDFVHLNDENVRMQYINVFAQVQDPLIIDVRDCPGGSPETAYFILSHLFPDGTPLFKLITRSSDPKTFCAASTFPFYETYNTVKKYTGKVSVLVNGNTASAAESLSFVLQNRKRAKIYGSRTATHAHIQMGVPVDNIIVHIPFAKTTDPDTDKDWEGVGIIPDYDVTTKEFVNLIYNELAANNFTPVPTPVKAPERKQRAGVLAPNPFAPPVIDN